MIGYSRFAERLAAQRASKDPATRWDLYKEFHGEWGFRPVSEPEPHDEYFAALIGRPGTGNPDDAPGIPQAPAEWWVLPAAEAMIARLGGADWSLFEPEQ